MVYGLLPVKHTNARYQAGIHVLAQKELQLLLSACGIDPVVYPLSLSGMEVIAFESPPLTAGQAAIVADHSLLYWLFEVREDQSLLPVLSHRQELLGADLPYIQKYKGKTNERFTELLINMALYSSAYATEKAVRLLDPMCGRGTTLFLALNRGMLPTGADADRGEVQECARFFQRYLEYHRIKHKHQKHARTYRGANIPMESFSFSIPGGEGALSLAVADARQSAGLSRARHHILVADLPYGVQHAPSGKGSLQALMEDVSSEWFAALEPGGALALAFNRNTLRRDAVISALMRAGFRMAEGDCYEGLEHWVEQAVTRDLLVAVVPTA